MASLKIEDRYPLASHRGNLSGKASAIIKSIITGDWWRSDPATGDVPSYVERNAQFHVNQGPVDMEIKLAGDTKTPSSFADSSKIGTYLPRSRGQTGKKETSVKFNEIYLWHVHTSPSDKPFSTVPTKY